MGQVKCKRCSGEGKATDYEDTCFAAYFKRCERCGGTGYVEEGGETISYSSGKVPESDSQVAKLVREARERHAAVGNGPMAQAKMILVAGFVPELCDALEEREREVERLRGAIDRACVRFFGDGSDGEAANQMRIILEEAFGEREERDG